MKDSEDILLARWLSGDITEEQRRELAAKYDLAALEHMLDKQEALKLESVSESDMWTGIMAKRKSPSEDQNKTLEKPKVNKLRRYISLVSAFLVALVLYTP